MDVNTQCYYQSALKLFLPVELESELEGFKITLGKQPYYFYDLFTPLNNTTSMQISRNKYYTNKILEKGGIPVPKAEFIHVSEFENGMLDEKIKSLSFPLVVKPYNGKFGEDVLCNIQTKKQLKNYLSKLFNQYEFLSLEEFHANLTSYRVLILNQRVLAVIIRHPASVIGDGEHSIQQLVALTNKKRAEINDTLSPILMDEECQIRLKELGIDEHYVPQKEESVSLGYTCNASRGGTYQSVSKKMLKQNKKLLVKAANLLNLNLVGFDVLCQDLNLPIETTGGVIIESNDSPSIRIHEQPIMGKAVLVTRKIIRSLIFRHPLSYLYGLYRHHPMRFYTRSFILLVILSLFFKFY